MFYLGPFAHTHHRMHDNSVTKVIRIRIQDIRSNGGLCVYFYYRIYNAHFNFYFAFFPISVLSLFINNILFLFFSPLAKL